MKGPVYVTMFKPLSIAIAVVMGVTFLGDTLYLGRFAIETNHSSKISVYNLHILQIKDLMCSLCLHSAFCSLLGAAIISVGFYTVLWGKAKEESGDDSGADSLESPSSNKAPLLQTYKTENV